MTTHDAIDLANRCGRAALGLLTVTLAVLLATAPPAAAQISGASASTSGSTGNSGDSDGSRRSSVAIQINNGTQLKTRFAWNISSDVGIFSTRDTNGSAQHNVSFNATAPGAYFLTVDTQRTGDMNRINDASGCDGDVDLSGVGGSQSGGTLTSGSLGLADPGSIPVGGSTVSGPFNQTATARIDDTSNGVAQGISLSFTWSGSTRSNSCEAAVRMGEGSSVTGCDACGYPGNPSRTNSTDGHFVTVTYTSLCGNGVVDSGQGELCDTAIASHVCCNSMCTFATGTECRPTAGVCDVAENCTGGAATCPANGFASTATTCRPSAGVCDVAENCTGNAAACPVNGFQSTAMTCRPSAGVCDTAENCPGNAAACPGDGFASTATVCRPSAGVCDTAENCLGNAAACPGDGFASTATVCRAAGGDCDVAENCTGGGTSCPGDDKSTALCRPVAGVCDTAESCDGVSNDCPPDQVEPPTTPCRATGGVCDVAESCDGVGIDCPADDKSTAVCRPTADVCDVAESCDGAGNDCPADEFQPSTVECRAGAGVCDVAENCTGSGAACPGDGFEPSTTVCRPVADDCDAAENCTGGAAACPSDDPVPDGTTCSDANTCTLDDMCVAGACVGDSMLCGDTILQDGCGEQCDDGNVDAGDGCSPSCQVEPGLACTTAPLSGCRRPFVPGKASLKMLKKTPDKDSIKWKWLKGERTTLEEYGDPLTSTNYQVCIYDASGRRFEITVPAGGTCAGKPCWKAAGFKAFKYKDKELTPDGAQKLQLKEGALAKAKILLSARGTELAMPDLTTLTQPLTVQIQQTDGLCWEAIYSGPATIHTSTIFKDKAD